MKKKLTAEQVAFQLCDALMYVCIRHEINAFDEPAVVEALKAFSRLSGTKESQWELVYESISRAVQEAAQ